MDKQQVISGIVSAQTILKSSSDALDASNQVIQSDRVTKAQVYISMAIEELSEGQKEVEAYQVPAIGIDSTMTAEEEEKLKAENVAPPSEESHTEGQL